MNFIAGITKASDSPDTSSRRLEGSFGEGCAMGGEVG